MSDTVAKRSPQSAAMAQGTERMRALMGGTMAMREAGEKYLPQFSKENDRGYRARLNSSWLFNGYRKTVRDMSGRVFDKPVAVETSSTEIASWLENVDLQGSDLSTFALEVFKDGLSGAGISYIMVDAPPRPDGQITRGQAQAQGLRPYLVHLRVEEVLGWKTETIKNKMVLSQIRIMEKVDDEASDDPFEDAKVDQIRVLNRLDNGVEVTLYRKTKRANNREQWAIYDEPYLTGLGEITVVPFYANRAGFFIGEPVLDDLADVNIAHWQSQSDQRNILHVARVPILHAAGRQTDEGEIVIGANQAVGSVDPNAKLEWVEHSGQAIGAGRQDLKDLEFQMETHGMQLLVARDGAQSATGEALDAKKETSQLAMIADNLKGALENAIGFMAEYGGVDGSDVGVEVNNEFGVSMMTAQDVQAMLMAVNTGNMSRETFLSEMKRRGFISEGVVVDDEIERIDADDAAGLLDGAE